MMGGRSDAGLSGSRWGGACRPARDWDRGGTAGAAVAVAEGAAASHRDKLGDPQMNIGGNERRLHCLVHQGPGLGAKNAVFPPRVLRLLVEDLSALHDKEAPLVNVGSLSHTADQAHSFHWRRQDESR